MHIHWLYIYLHFYPQNGILQWSRLFFLPSLTSHHISRLSENGVSLRTELTGSWHARWSLSRAPFTERLQAGSAVRWVRTALVPLGLCAHLMGVCFSTWEGICALSKTCQAGASLFWILSLFLPHALSPVENADSYAECECCLCAHIWQMFAQIFNWGLK